MTPYSSNVSKLGWSIVVIALMVLLVIALRRWWYELGEVERLRSDISPRWKQLKNIRRQR